MDMKTAVSMLFAFCVAGTVGCVADTSPGTPPRTGDDARMQALLEEFPEATQIDDHSIGWDHGKVVMVLPEHDAGELPAEAHGAEPGPVIGLDPAISSFAVHGCPTGWYCVYQDASWGGRRLQFSDCARNDLSNYGFRDKTSSWVNNGSHRVQVKNDLTARPDPVLWTMPPHSSSSYVGNANNDKADYFQCS
jgi:peptidase inhibitor family I36